MKRIKFFASILLMLCLSVACCAQTKIDWKQIKNIPDTLEFKNVLLEHLLFKSAYQPVMESIHQGAIYYDNQLERLRVYENGEWRDLSVSIASDSIGAPLTILGYLQASDIYASRSAYIGKDINVKGNINGSGTTRLNSLIVNNTLKIPTTASTTLGVGSIYYNPTTKKLNILNSSNQWEPISIEVDSALSATSTNPVQNKVVKQKFDDVAASLTYNIAIIDGRINTLNTNLLASLTQGLTQANASASLYASSAVTISEGYAQGLATSTYNAATAYTDALRTYVDSQDSRTLGSATAYVTDGTHNLDVHNINVRNQLTASETTTQSAYVDKSLSIGNPTGQHLQGKYSYRFYTKDESYTQGHTTYFRDGALFYSPLHVFGKMKCWNSLIIPVKTGFPDSSNIEQGYLFFNNNDGKLYIYDGSEFVDVSSGSGSGVSYETKYLAVPLYGIGKNSSNNTVWGEAYSHTSAGYYRVVCHATEENTIVNSVITKTRLTVDLTPRLLPESYPSAGLVDQMVDIQGGSSPHTNTLTPGWVAIFNSTCYSQDGTGVAYSTVGTKGGFEQASTVVSVSGQPYMANQACAQDLSGTIVAFAVVNGDIYIYNGGLVQPSQGGFPTSAGISKNGKNISFESTNLVSNPYTTFVWEITW